MWRCQRADDGGFILVPGAYDPSDLWLGSRALTRPDFLSMRRVFVLHSQPIRFAGFDGKSVNRGLPVLDQTRALNPSQPQARRIVGSGNQNDPFVTSLKSSYRRLIEFVKEISEKLALSACTRGQISTD